jgi:hypothetical protein
VYKDDFVDTNVGDVFRLKLFGQDFVLIEKEILKANDPSVEVRYRVKVRVINSEKHVEYYEGIFEDRIVITPVCSTYKRVKCWRPGKREEYKRTNVLYKVDPVSPKTISKKTWEHLA